MPGHYGLRSKTRTLFKKAYRTKGMPHSNIYLRTFKRGDYVDIKVDSSIHKGMPFKYYHGRTGVVFNVNKRALGVTVNKQVNGRIVKKDLHVALPHLHKSKCRDEIIRRKAENEAIKKAAREGGEKKSLKRRHVQPKDGYVYKVVVAQETIKPLK